MRTKRELQTALQFERWIEIAESHSAFWRIVEVEQSRVFQIGIDYAGLNGDEIARWEDITSTRELWIALGY